MHDVETRDRRTHEAGGVSRRRFLELGAAGLAAAALGGGFRFLPSLVDASEAAGGAGFTGSVASCCGLCVNKCGLYARVRDGIVTKLDPVPDHPKSRGMLCARGNAGIKTLYDPNRLKAPLIRKGARGAGEWRQASWEAAMDHVAEKLTGIRDELGPEGVLFSSTEGFQEHFFLWFAQTWGSPNVARHPTLCLASMVNGMFNTFGTVPDVDMKNSRYVILAGANRFEALITPDSVDLMRGLGGSRKLVVIDPRFTITASKADEWVPIRPGTDLAFVLAMLNVIISEDRVDREFIDRYTIGFDELREHVIPHTPEWAEAQCDVDAHAIRRIAREFAAAAPRVCFYPGRRSSWYRTDTQFRRAIAIVNAVVGAWDRPGALIPRAKISLGEPDIFPPDDIEVGRFDKLTECFPVANRRDGTYLNMRDSFLSNGEQPVKAWMIYKQNPLHSVPDSARTLRMMERMDFIVTIDTHPSDTAWMSDVILPESIYLERNDPAHSIAGAVPVVQFRQQVVPPRHDTRDCFWMMKELANRLDMGMYFDVTAEEWLEAQLEELPISLDELRKKGFYTDRETPEIGKTLKEGYRFRTKSGKIELRSLRYEEKGHDPLPVYQPPRPVPKGRYRLLTGRSALYTHSSLQGNPWLAGADPIGPRVWIHPKSAARHGVTNGDPIGIRSAAGEVRAHVNVTERIRPDAVFIPHGFGSRSAGLNELARQGPRDSDVIGSDQDDITGNAAMHETVVELFPVEGERLPHEIPASTRADEEAHS